MIANQSFLRLLAGASAGRAAEPGRSREPEGQFVIALNAAGRNGEGSGEGAASAGGVHHEPRLSSPPARWAARRREEAPASWDACYGGDGRFLHGADGQTMGTQP